MAPDVILMDEDQFFQKKTIEENAAKMQQEREDAGIDDIAKSMQPTTMPKIDQSLIGKHLEICVQCDLLDGEGHKTRVTNRWCAGVVTQVSNGKKLKKPRSHHKAGTAAEIEFDEIKERKEKSHKQVHELKSSKWNPKKEHLPGCWRMDVSSFRRND